MNYEIKKFDKKDLLDVFKVESKVFGDKAYGIEVFFELINNKDIFYVAKKEKKVIGYVLAGLLRDKIKLISIGVLPSHQKKGVGTKLLNKVEEKARENKTDFIELEVNKNKKEAINFYKNLGFQKNVILKNYYATGEDAYLMRKKVQ